MLYCLGLFPTSLLSDRLLTAARLPGYQLSNHQGLDAAVNYLHLCCQ